MKNSLLILVLFFANFPASKAFFDFEVSERKAAGAPKSKWNFFYADRIPVQRNGKIVSLNTYAREVLSEIYGKEVYRNWKPVDVIFSWFTARDKWLGDHDFNRRDRLDLFFDLSKAKTLRIVPVLGESRLIKISEAKSDFEKVFVVKLNQLVLSYLKNDHENFEIFSRDVMELSATSSLNMNRLFRKWSWQVYRNKYLFSHGRD